MGFKGINYYTLKSEDSPALSKIDVLEGQEFMLSNSPVQINRLMLG